MNFTVGGCRISVSFPLLAVAAALLFCDRSGIFATVLASAALHEGGHLLAMYALKCLPERIRVTPFGADIVRPDRVDRSYLRDAMVSLAGPAANLVQAAVLWMVCPDRFSNFRLAGLALFLFNLLPVGPLDGGQALYSLLCRICTPDTAGHVVSVVSFLVLAPLAALGFLVLFRSKWNFSLLLVCVYLMALLVLKKENFG